MLVLSQIIISAILYPIFERNKIQFFKKWVSTLLYPPLHLFGIADIKITSHPVGTIIENAVFACVVMCVGTDTNTKKRKGV